MTIDYIQNLIDGKTNFIKELSETELNKLIENIRINPNKAIIIQKNLNYLKINNPKFFLNLCYDVEKEKDLVQEIIYPEFINNTYQVFNLINKTSWGTEYLINNIETLNNNLLNTLISTLFINYEENKNYLKQIAFHQNLHVRYLFMKHLITYYPEKLNEIYDDLTKYLKNDKYMKITELSELAALTFNVNSTLWNKLKKYILTNYKNNDLSIELNKITNGKEEIISDINTYLTTSRKDTLNLITNYEDKISKEILNEYLKYINIFQRKNQPDKTLEKIFEYELFEKLKIYINKYLSLSKTKDIYYLGTGTTCSAYRIGDYTIKLVKTKWSYEDIICPNLYLILKNLEEDYVRDKNNIVKSGLEIQKYLKKDAQQVPNYIFKEFDKELERLGYKLNDKKINGQCGDNCMLLDSYTDADTKIPEELPEWFKEYPLVLIDRDRIYRTDQLTIKQQNSSY